MEAVLIDEVFGTRQQLRTLDDLSEVDEQVVQLKHLPISPIGQVEQQPSIGVLDRRDHLQGVAQHDWTHEDLFALR